MIVQRQKIVLLLCTEVGDAFVSMKQNMNMINAGQTLVATAERYSVRNDVV
jgi:hypothetical protein